MDIRTKLIFALVAVSLGSMLTFAAVVAPDVDRRLTDRTLSELAGLAEAKREAVRWILEGWRERTALVASRTQLRESLAEHARSGGEAPARRISRSLEDALASSASAALLEVRVPEGEIVAVARRDGEPAAATSGAASGTSTPRSSAAAAGLDSSLPTATDGIRYAGVSFPNGGPPRVGFVAPLDLDGRRVGMLRAEYVAGELADLIGHDHGLGETGELLVLAPDAGGGARVLHPTLASPEGAGLRLPGGPGSVAGRAFAVADGGAGEPVFDEDGEGRWIASRIVDETGWAVVVSVGSDEPGRASSEFGRSLRRTALILSAFAILAGFLLGLFFALPIQHLAEVADRIGAGDMSARAEVEREDEVGLLARTFNEMAAELEEKMALLHEFRKFFDVSIDLMCMAGLDGYFKRVNPAFERALGWSEEELLARQFYDFVHPDDVAKTEAEVAKLSQAIPTISFVNRYACKDGSYKTLRWASYPDPETGMLYAIAHVMDDETADRP